MSEFVIRALRGGGPADLGESLPLRASTLTCLPDGSGQGEFWCAGLDNPVKYRIDGSFDRRRCQPEFLAVDGAGEFLWVTVVVVCTTDPNEHLHPGMAGLHVQLAYVVDQTLGQDKFFDPAKVDVVAAAVLDDVAVPSTPHEPAEIPAAGTAPPPAQPMSDPQEPDPGAMDPQEFHRQLDRAVATLATLTGLHPGRGVPTQTAVGIGERPRRPTYQIGPNGLRYYRFDPADEWQWVTASDLDELLYRVVDDTTRDLAWRWSEKAPMAAAGMPRWQRTAIATGFWRTLMAALDASWGIRTAETIDALDAAPTADSRTPNEA